MAAPRRTASTDAGPTRLSCDRQERSARYCRYVERGLGPVGRGAARSGMGLRWRRGTARPASAHRLRSGAGRRRWRFRSWRTSGRYSGQQGASRDLNDWRNRPAARCWAEVVQTKGSAADLRLWRTRHGAWDARSRAAASDGRRRCARLGRPDFPARSPLCPGRASW
jgi:hypothetical protein